MLLVSVVHENRSILIYIILLYLLLKEKANKYCNSIQSRKTTSVSNFLLTVKYSSGIEDGGRSYYL